MKIVYKSQTKRYKNSAGCIAIEYPTEDKDINVAVVEIHGRYPDKGRVRNTVCKELVYVSKGSGKVEVDDKKIDLRQGDMIVIEVREKYFFEGEITLFVSCSPAWFPEQHSIDNTI